MKEKQTKIYKSFDFEIKTSDEDKREIEAIGSFEKADRDGDVIKIDGIDLKSYKKNPVFLWSHDSYSPPIGKANKVWKDGKKLLFKLKYAEAEDNPFADTIYRMTKAGYIKSFSIGFAPDWKEAIFNEKNNGYDFNKVELLELSAVNVPANPLALVQSKDIQKAITDKVVTKDEVNELEKFLKGLVKEEDPDKDMEDVIQDVKDELEKGTEDEDENKEQTIKIGIVCKSCGTKLICPICDNIEKDLDSDPFKWLFEEHQTDKSNDGSHEQTADKLLNSMIHED